MWGFLTLKIFTSSLLSCASHLADCTVSVFLKVIWARRSVPWEGLYFLQKRLQFFMASIPFDSCLKKGLALSFGFCFWMGIGYGRHW